MRDQMRKIYLTGIKNVYLLFILIPTLVVAGLITSRIGMMKISIAIMALLFLIIAVGAILLICFMVVGFRQITEWDEGCFAEIEEMSLHYSGKNSHDVEKIAVINYIYRDSNAVKHILEEKNYSLLFKRYAYLSNKMAMYDEFVDDLKSIITSVLSALLVYLFYSVQTEIKFLHMHVFFGVLVLIFTFIVLHAMKVKDNPGYYWILKYEQEILDSVLQEVSKEISLTKEQKNVISQKQLMIKKLIKEKEKTISRRKKKRLEEKIRFLENADIYNFYGRYGQIDWSYAQNFLNEEYGWKCKDFLCKLGHELDDENNKNSC